MSVFSDALWRWRLPRALRAIAVAWREDLIVPDGLDGWVHVPWALLRPDGIRILDVLDGAGQLIAGDLLPEWTMVGRRRFLFPNPLPALQHEQAAVKLLAGAVPVDGFLVLRDGLQLARARPRAVVSLAELNERLALSPANVTLRRDYTEAWDRLLAAARNEK